MGHSRRGRVITIVIFPLTQGTSAIYTCEQDKKNYTGIRVPQVTCTSASAQFILRMVPQVTCTSASAQFILRMVPQVTCTSASAQFILIKIGNYELQIRRLPYKE